MACFAAPAALGVLTVLFGKRFPTNWHISWLNKMIFGGTLVLGIEHIIHGEIVPWPPFLTAMATPTGTAAMFGEILAIGIPMTIALVLVWLLMVLAYEKIPVILVRSKVLASATRISSLPLMLLGAMIMIMVDCFLA